MAPALSLCANKESFSINTVYAAPKASSGGFKSGSFSSPKARSSGYKSGSFSNTHKKSYNSSSKSKSYNSGSGSKSYSSPRRSYIPIPIPWHSHYYGGGIFGSTFSGVFRLIIIIIIIIVIIKIIKKSRRY